MKKIITSQTENTAWQYELRHAVREPSHLLQLLALPTSLLDTIVTENQDFSLRVPHGYVAKMEKGNINDPLLRQVLPLKTEQNNVPNFVTDPVGDKKVEKIAGLLHKYQGRVLLVATGVCAIHCRYCFRRHFDYANAYNLNHPAFLEAIQADETIKEVILSGGDPLNLSDEKLPTFINNLAKISHVKRLRIHTRLPIVLPERMTANLLSILTATRLQTVMVVHANHANEIDEIVGQTLFLLTKHGINVLNQTVLLKGINNEAQTLINLSERLFEYRVIPYYLHLLDRVQGAAHFEVSEEKGKQLIETMRCQLSGYLVPKLVREVSGLPYKLPIV